MLLNLLLASACAIQRPIQQEQLTDLGRFEYRAPEHGMKGVIIGAPRGGSEPASAEYAKWISDRTGAGFVVAHGFRSKRLAVSQPIVRSVPYHPAVSDDPARRGSVFREFKSLLRRVATGNVEFYVGVRFAAQDSNVDHIEVASSGLTFEEIAALKGSFNEIRDRFLADTGIPRIAMAVEPVDKISWRVSAVKHHGVLMISEKGLNLRLPRVLASRAVKATYREILASWVKKAITVVDDNPLRLPQVEVRIMDFGRIEFIPSRKKRKGVVVGAPHGSYDEFTAEAVKQIGYRTGLATVVAKGFTPTEAGGWRINVNRPTEKSFFSSGFELRSERSSEVYEAFKAAVLQASQGGLALYIDIHQYSRDKKIQVATVGVSMEEAVIIKRIYEVVRDNALKRAPDIGAIKLVIEPLDVIEIGAWDAKAHGILGVAKKSLHFEIPGYGVLFESKARDVYTRILADLLIRTTPLLVNDGMRKTLAP